MTCGIACYFGSGGYSHYKDCHMERLVMVGDIGKADRPGIIKGIGIWELDMFELREIARMPHKFFQGFGEFDDVFSSSGTDELKFADLLSQRNSLMQC